MIYSVLNVIVANARVFEFVFAEMVRHIASGKSV